MDEEGERERERRERQRKEIDCTGMNSLTHTALHHHQVSNACLLHQSALFVLSYPWEGRRESSDGVFGRGRERSCEVVYCRCDTDSQLLIRRILRREECVLRQRGRRKERCVSERCRTKCKMLSWEDASKWPSQPCSGIYPNQRESGFEKLVREYRKRRTCTERNEELAVPTMRFERRLGLICSKITRLNLCNRQKLYEMVGR